MIMTCPKLTSIKIFCNKQHLEVQILYDIPENSKERKDTSKTFRKFLPSLYAKEVYHIVTYFLHRDLEWVIFSIRTRPWSRYYKEDEKFKRYLTESIKRELVIINQSPLTKWASSKYDKLKSTLFCHWHGHNTNWIKSLYIGCATFSLYASF